jgi:hypothetical protein
MKARPAAFASRQQLPSAGGVSKPGPPSLVVGHPPKRSCEGYGPSCRPGVVRAREHVTETISVIRLDDMPCSLLSRITQNQIPSRNDDPREGKGGRRGEREEEKKHPLRTWGGDENID